MPADTWIVSNNPEATWLEIRRPVLSVPLRTWGTVDAPNPGFQSDMAALDSLAAHRPVLAIVKATFYAPVDAGDLAKLTRLRAVATCGNGIDLWAAPGSETAARARQLCTPT